jgi:hypothetical protein
MRFAAFIFVLVSLSGFGQSDHDLFHISAAISPIRTDTSTMTLHMLEISLRYPLAVKNSNKVFGGIGYESMWTNDTEILRSHHVQSLSTQLVFMRTLSDKRMLLFLASAGVYSDFKDVSGEDFRYSAGFRYRVLYTKDLSISYGLGVVKQFFGGMIVPVVDFDWRITDRLRLSGPIPVNTKLSYSLVPRVRLIFSLRPDNATYRLSENSYQSRYLQMKQWTAGMTCEYQVTKHWVISLRGAYVARRKFEIYNSDQKGTLSILTFDVRGVGREPSKQFYQNAFSGEVTVALVLPGDRDKNRQH